MADHHARGRERKLLQRPARVPVHRHIRNARGVDHPPLRLACDPDCGFPDPSPITQYSGSSFAQPIRRVFMARTSAVREEVAMPAPGDVAPAHFSLVVTDPIWTWLYQPLAGAVEFASTQLNHLQFLTIRRYLSLVFFSLVALLLVLAIWS